jgi:hypothetical protein
VEARIIVVDGWILSMSRLFEALAKDGVIVLPKGIPSPARCLVAVVDEDFDTLRAEAGMNLPESKQQRMSELLRKNRDGELTEQERAELDVLAREFDAVTLRKGRALGILAQLDSIKPPT